ncbi:MAG: hypothetical protein ABR978_07205 [Dehalococcoidia bacterium]
MLHRFLVPAIVAGSLLVTAFLLVFAFAGPEWGGKSRPVAEALPQTADGVLNDSNEYQSSVLGYSIRFPRDWTPNPASVNLDKTSTDVFYALNESDAGVAPTLSITKESVDPGTTSEDFLASWVSYLDQGWSGVSKPEAIDVGGTQGYLVDYEGFSHNNPVQLTSAVLVEGQDGWEVVLAVPKGERSQFRPLLAAVLNSLTIH